MPNVSPSEPETAWTNRDLSNPHAVDDKAARVQRMFSAIARSYDLNNRLHSMWRDQAWRRAAVKMATPRGDEVVLDVASGTGDLAEAFVAGGAGRVLGSDFTVPMLQIARDKARRLADRAPVYHAADALRLPVADQSVDVVSIAFGIRNVAEPDAALREFYRVLRPGGRLIVLEFSHPTNSLVRGLDRLYREHIMPHTATWIARDRSGAYRYLPRSVSTFLDRKQMVQSVTDAGFIDVVQKPLTLGIAVCYRAVRDDRA